MVAWIAIGMGMLLGMLLGVAVYVNAKRCGRSGAWGWAIGILSVLAFIMPIPFGSYLPFLLLIIYLFIAGGRCAI